MLTLREIFSLDTDKVEAGVAVSAEIVLTALDFSSAVLTDEFTVRGITA